LLDDLPVRLDGVVKRYGGRTVLDGVSLEVTPGITGLVGPNGAGKSTLVRAILGLVRLAEGSVRVFGLDPAREPRRVRSLLGVVPEDECSVPGLSGVEMVRYAARLCGLPGTESLRRAHEVLDWCDAGQERYRPVETLSVGTRQKVAFAAAIVHDPRMVILDEPTNGRDHGKTVFVSTHVLPDVQSICDRVVVLARGRVRLTGSIEQLARPATPTHRLQGDGPLDALAQLLTARGLPARLADDANAGMAETGGMGAILLEPPGPDRLGLVWKTARDAGVVIRSLEPSCRPLEEVFVQALRDAESADASGQTAGESVPVREAVGHAAS
jgi:ABC-2 type transport system ATP-binding protein